MTSDPIVKFADNRGFSRLLIFITWLLVMFQSCSVGRIIGKCDAIQARLDAIAPVTSNLEKR